MPTIYFSKNLCKKFKVHNYFCPQLMLPGPDSKLIWEQGRKTFMAESSVSGVPVRRSERLKRLREGQPPEVTSRYFVSSQRAVRKRSRKRASSEE